MSRPVDFTFVKHKKLNKAKHIKCYLKPEQRRELIKATSDQASMLYEYYLNMVSVEDRVITDETSAAYFGWTINKAKRHRLSLEKAGYYRVERLRAHQGESGYVYYIGKEVVSKEETEKNV